MTTMRRVAVLAAAISAMGGLAGCVGDTTPATDVRSNQAQLNAKGHTNNGPASWWWEYGISRKDVQNGAGLKTPKQGPATSASDVSLNAVVKGLDRSQGYYFRACGQDQAAGSPVTCGRILSFATAPGDSTLTQTNSFASATFQAAPNVAHNLTLSRRYTFAEADTILEHSDPSSSPPTGAAIIPSGASCSATSSDPYLGYNDTGTCVGTGPSYTPIFTLNLGNYSDLIVSNTYLDDIVVNLGGGDDLYDGTSGGQIAAHGGPGNDSISAGGGSRGSSLAGEANNDQLFGGKYDDSLDGGDGNDTLYGGGGTNTYTCGPGYDIVHVTSAADEAGIAADCESIVVDAPAAQKRAEAAAMATARASIDADAHR